MFGAGLGRPFGVRRLCAALVMALASASSYAECEMPEEGDPRDIANRTCSVKAQTALYRGEVDPCVQKLRAAAESSMLKAKKCLKREKNGEGLRALGEYWAAWSEAISAMSSRGAVDQVERRYDEALKKLKVLEAIL